MLNLSDGEIGDLLITKGFDGILVAPLVIQVCFQGTRKCETLRETKHRFGPCKS